MSHRMGDQIKQAKGATGTQCFKSGENMSSGINRAVRIDGGHVEQDSIWLEFLEEVYFNAYCNRQMKNEALPYSV